MFYLSELLNQRPDYEHGLPHYHLACAYEELGDYQAARAEYEKAISWAPDDGLRLGGYASFLYLHGSPKDALQAYVRLLKLERKTTPDKDDSELVKITLKISEILNISKNDIALILNE